MPPSTEILPYFAEDAAVDEVIATWRSADPQLTRTAAVFRATFDQLYDGQHTGRYRWGQLYKTEKTHFGTLLEINLRREFHKFIGDGVKLDYTIAGHEIDCKFSQHSGAWMIPPEALGELLLVAHASDELAYWELGVVRATEENLGSGRNRDMKRTLNSTGRSLIRWIAQDGQLPPNVLLSLGTSELERIFAAKSGQARILELCRVAEGRRFGRNTVATVAQQDDYMKRMRENGGARSRLAAEGFIIPGGDYLSHRVIAAELGAEVPGPGEFVSLRVIEVHYPHAGAVTEIDGRLWRLAGKHEECGIAPRLPNPGLVKAEVPPQV